MFYHQATNTYITEGQAFSLGGTQYPANWLNLASPSDKAAAGLVEVSTSGTPGDERYFFVSEELVNGVRVISNVPKPPEMIAATLLAAAKQARASAVEAIQVTTQAGHTFDGDELSQGRMARAALVLSSVGGTVPWVLADNSVVNVGAPELIEALALAGAAQATLWVQPYTQAT